jgi:hypothetical protein
MNSFDKRIKLFAKLLLVINLLDLYFYDSSKPLWNNAVNLSLGMGFGALIAWGVHVGKNWARILVYFSFVLSLISLVSWVHYDIWQRGTLIVGVISFGALLTFLHLHPADTARSFQASAMKRKWKIAIIALGSILVLMMTAITLTGLYFRKQGSSLAEEMKASLVLTGNVDPKILDTCKEKFGRKIADPEILGKFCHCFGLNLDKVTKDTSSNFVTRSVALTMACWPAEAGPLKGLKD